MGGGAQWTKMGGQEVLIHFLRFKYFKNYIRYEKSENTKIFNFIFF